MAKNQIEFTGVHQTRFEFVGKPKRGPGGPSIRSYFEGAWLEPIRVAMGWKEIDVETVKGTPRLRGALVGCQVTMTPVDPELQQHQITMRVQRVGNFEVFLPEQTTKKEKPPVLRFRVESADDGLETKLGNWGRILGDCKARLKINYGELQKKAKHGKDDDDDGQEKLPLTGAALEEHRANTKTTPIRRVKK
jgi:hypothetical protein